MSDGHSPDQVTRVDHNPNRDWVFQGKPQCEPRAQLPLAWSDNDREVTEGGAFAEINDYLNSIPVPVKGAEPEQNCVSWTRSAIRELQEKGLAEQFEVDKFMDDALRYADQHMRDPEMFSERLTTPTGQCSLQSDCAEQLSQEHGHCFFLLLLGDFRWLAL